MGFKGCRMRTLCVGALFATTLITTACSGDSTGPEEVRESVNGTYYGDMAGLSQGVAMAGSFSVTINQSGGTLSGSWSMQAQVTDGVSAANVQGTGSLTGTVGSGANPSLNITIRGSCPNYEARFSGTYDSANRRLTLIGPIDILNPDCTVAVRYPSTVVLNR